MTGTKKITRGKILLTIKEFIEMWVNENNNLASITENSDVIKNLGLDSIGVLYLIMSLERTFNINIQNDDINYKTVAVIENLISLVESKLNENHQSVEN